MANNVLTATAYFTQGGTDSASGTGSVVVDALAIFFPQDVDNDGVLFPTEITNSTVVARLTVPSTISPGQTWSVDAGTYGVFTGTVTTIDASNGYIDILVPLLPPVDTPDPLTSAQVPVPVFTILNDIDGDDILNDIEAAQTGRGLKIALPSTINPATDRIAISENGGTALQFALTGVSQVEIIDDFIYWRPSSQYTEFLSNNTNVAMAVQFQMADVNNPGPLVNGVAAERTFVIQGATLSWGDTIGGGGDDILTPGTNPLILPIKLGISPTAIGMTWELTYSYTRAVFNTPTPPQLSTGGTVETVTQTYTGTVTESDAINAGIYRLLPVHAGRGAVSATWTISDTTGSSVLVLSDQLWPMPRASTETAIVATWVNDLDNDGIISVTEHNPVLSVQFDLPEYLLPGTLCRAEVNLSGGINFTNGPFIITDEILTQSTITVEVPYYNFNPATGDDYTLSLGVTFGYPDVTYYGGFDGTYDGVPVTDGVTVVNKPSVAGMIEWLADTDNDGVIHLTEYQPEATVRIHLPVEVIEGDLLYMSPVYGELGDSWFNAVPAVRFTPESYVSGHTGHKTSITAEDITLGYIDIDYTYSYHGVTDWQPMDAGDQYIALTVHITDIDSPNLLLNKAYCISSLTLTGYNEPSWRVGTPALQDITTLDVPAPYWAPTPLAVPVNALPAPTGDKRLQYITSSDSSDTMSVRVPGGTLFKEGMRVWLLSAFPTANHSVTTVTETDVTNGYVDFVLENIQPATLYCFASTLDIPGITPPNFHQYGALELGNSRQLRFMTAPSSAASYPFAINHDINYTALNFPTESPLTDFMRLVGNSVLYEIDLDDMSTGPGTILRSVDALNLNWHLVTTVNGDEDYVYTSVYDGATAPSYVHIHEVAGVGVPGEDMTVTATLTLDCYGLESLPLPTLTYTAPVVEVLPVRFSVGGGAPDTFGPQPEDAMDYDETPDISFGVAIEGESLRDWFLTDDVVTVVTGLQSDPDTHFTQSVTVTGTDVTNKYVTLPVEFQPNPGGEQRTVFDIYLYRDDVLIGISSGGLSIFAA